MPAIYLDNAASTRVSDEVLALVTEVMRTAWGNPSSHHPQGAAARGHLETARTRLLAALGDSAGAGDIIWTSGCSEANALAVLGAARTHEGAIAISTLEHPAITTLADALASEGREVRQIAPGRDGVLDPDDMARAAVGAGVVAFLAVQNELGTVQPIAAIITAIRAVAPTAHIHVDAAQALGKIALDAGCGADSISIAGHKLHAPKGVGALWLRKTARIAPLWVGGGQQPGLRGGTQDAPSAAALGLAVPATPAAARRNVLSSRGVFISTGSACADAGAKASPALTAIGLPEADGMVRFSFAHDTTLDDVTAAATILADAIASLAT